MEQDGLSIKRINVARFAGWDAPQLTLLRAPYAER